METARKNHELKLLRDIELAGEKSWQAKAWMAERVYSYAQPSARLQVSGGVEHTAGGSFAALLAGLASRRAEKKAQVIESQEVKQIEDVKGKYNSYCPTNKSQTIVTPTPKNSGKPRPLRMRRRKPRAESLKKWPVHDTPPTTPPATDSHA
jgi:phytoene dehydrogenase-like protein